MNLTPAQLLTLKTALLAETNATLVAARTAGRGLRRGRRVRHRRRESAVIYQAWHGRGSA